MNKQIIFFMCVLAPNVLSASNFFPHDRNNESFLESAFIGSKEETPHQIQKSDRKRKQKPTTKPARPRLAPAAVTILKIWFYDHFINPYPSQDEKINLAEQAKLQLSQVNNWFTNERRRNVNYQELFYEESIEPQPKRRRIKYEALKFDFEKSELEPRIFDLKTIKFEKEDEPEFEYDPHHADEFMKINYFSEYGFNDFS